MISQLEQTGATKFLVHKAPRIRLIGDSRAMRRVEREALLAARVNANVLVTGERGVGKTLVARFIHEHSDRSPFDFATIKCAGLPDVLFESLLFGHALGSFAGAYRDKPGLLESASGGTIFLDGVDALSLRMQARLLRFLESGEYVRIGADSVKIQPRPDVRLIASTTTDLPARVAAGLFLDGLYLRLNIIRLPVPPLRERRDDIPALVGHFAEELAERRGSAQSEAPEVPSTLLDELWRTDWPGNVRELKDVAQRQLLRAATVKRI